MKKLTNYQRVMQVIKAERSAPYHIRASDIALYLTCIAAGDFTPMQATKLYTDYGNEYCHMIHVIHSLKLGGA